MYVARRHDLTFEVEREGLPYHVTEADPLFPPLLAEHSGLLPGMALVDGALTEDHRRERGWVNGVETVIEGFGPYPEGWSAAPPPLTLEVARERKLAEVIGGYRAAFSKLDAIYPLEEREGWPLQKEEALSLQADPAARTPVLSGLVALRGKGESVAELAEKVLHNAALWAQVYTLLTGQQQRQFAEVNVLAAVEEIMSYPVHYQLPEGF